MGLSELKAQSSMQQLLFAKADSEFVVDAELISEFIEPPSNVILRGDALQVLRRLPSNFVNTIVTSPPYYGQRDYGVTGQIGVEVTPDLYINNLFRIFEECKRVLRKDGTLWLNLGDKYRGGQLEGLPWRVALKLREAGWFLRSDIIWRKTNAMPTSVTDRPTTEHEYIFLFSQSPKYYYDTDSIREPHITFTDRSKMRGGRNHFGKSGGTPEKGKNGGNPNLHRGRWDKAFHPKGRNKRTVWEVTLSKFRDTHFAVFPEKLIEPCVLAGCPKNGIVLDPFCGSGTTGLVALRLQRRFLGIEINPAYCKMALKRLLPYSYLMQ